MISAVDALILPCARLTPLFITMNVENIGDKPSRFLAVFHGESLL